MKTENEKTGIELLENLAAEMAAREDIDDLIECESCKKLFDKIEIEKFDGDDYCENCYNEILYYYAHKMGHIDIAKHFMERSKNQMIYWEFPEDEY